MLESIFYIPGIGDTKWSALTALLWCLYLILKFIFKDKSDKPKGDSMTDSNQTAAPAAEVSAPKVGIEELKAVLGAGNALTLEVIKVIKKDGVSAKAAEDIVTDIIADSNFRSALTNAISNIKAVPAEIKDLDAGEALELGEYEFTAILTALKA